MINEGGPEIYTPDFVGEYKKRMAGLVEIPLKARDTLLANLEKAGIKEVQKFLPAITFYFPDDAFPLKRELWVGSPKDIEHPHDALFDELRFFIDTSETPYEPPMAQLSCYILQDGSGGAHLIIGREDVYEFAEEDLEAFQDMAQKYGLKKIIANFRKGVLPTTLLSVDDNLVEEMREEIYLLEYAKKWKMTNTQYLRFYALAKGRHHTKGQQEYAGGHMNYAELAKSIVLEDNGHI